MTATALIRRAIVEPRRVHMAGTNSPTSSLVLNAFIVCLLCKAVLIVSLVDWRNLRLTDDSQWRVTVPSSGADETRVGHSSSMCAYIGAALFVRRSGSAWGAGSALRIGRRFR